MSASSKNQPVDFQASTIPVSPPPQVDEIGQMSLFDRVWRNCDDFTKACLGNALDDSKYRTGVLTVIGLTLIFSSNSPALHSVFSMIEHHPSVPLLNAGAAVSAALGMIFFGDAFQAMAPCKPDTPPKLLTGSAIDQSQEAKIAGMELGLWKTLAATANLMGLATTSACHGAFLIQLTTLIVPLVQGVQGVPIARQIWAGVGLALVGLFMFTNDPTSAYQNSLQGDLLCMLAAVFYATYDLRLFNFGKRMGDTPAELIQFKVLTQALLSTVLVGATAAWQRFQGIPDEVTAFFQSVTTPELLLIVPVMLWSGLIVNAAASVLQVGAQQAVGAARAQILYATGPLWSAVMSMALLGEKAGPSSLAGGSLFLVAILVAATAPPPEVVCNEDGCEV